MFSRATFLSYLRITTPRWGVTGAIAERQMAMRTELATSLLPAFLPGKETLFPSNHSESVPLAEAQATAQAGMQL